MVKLWLCIYNVFTFALNCRVIWIERSGTGLLKQLNKSNKTKILFPSMYLSSIQSSPLFQLTYLIQSYLPVFPLSLFSPIRITGNDLTYILSQNLQQNEVAKSE